ncbi:hypothetical protein G6F56_013993 [Rhizopus delemar]|nr:hypothetical protein G6F56_013993 [Rhizopus delemar]
MPAFSAQLRRWPGCGAPHAGHRVVEDEARAAHQVAMAGIVDAAVVTEVVEEATVRIDAARVVERHRVGDVRTQERG